VKHFALLIAISVAANCAEQPVPFSHRTHQTAGLKCQDCHPNPDPGRAMTLPSASKCMNCHATVATDRPAIQKLASIAKSDQPIAWVRVAGVPEWVFWNHRPHLKAGVKCEACHGLVAQMEVVTQASNATKMAGCIECHREKKATVACVSCHELN
jgi:hypothetical protein